MVLESIAPLPLKRCSLFSFSRSTVKQTRSSPHFSSNPPPFQKLLSPLLSSRSNPIAHLFNLTIPRRIYPPPQRTWWISINNPHLPLNQTLHCHFHRTSYTFQPSNHLNCLVFAQIHDLSTGWIPSHHPCAATASVITARLILGLHLVNLTLVKK